MASDKHLDRIRSSASERSSSAGLAIDPSQVVIRAAPFSAPLSTINPGVAVFSGLPARISEMTPKKFMADVLVISGLTIGIQMADQSWLVVRQQDDLMHERVLRNVALFIGGLLLIGGLSIWLAHSLVKPLTQLTAAAEKLGREREPTPIGDMSIPEYATIARAFNEMQSRLKNFVDERTQMLAAISHDLRTPLTRMRLFAEYVKDQKQRRQLLSDISEMETMIDSSLTFASEEVKREPHSAVDIASLLISICDDFTDLGGRINYEGPNHAPLPCQPVAMRRALSNLIDNGRRYGERVAVTLREEPQAIVIRIQDCGPGIPAEQIERAFAPFQRLDNSRNRETGGTGLGLTIARDVIRGHGGDITLLPAEPTGLLVLVRSAQAAAFAPNGKCGCWREDKKSAPSGALFLL